MSLGQLENLSSVIDQNELLTRCLNNLDFAERMVALFQEQFCEEMTVLEQAFEQGNLDAVGKVAHRLQGACANAAAFGLKARAANVRNAVNEGSREKTTQCVSELQEEWRRFSSIVGQDKVASSVTV
jgi:HPt (histidine-containing phosphotransfer) domain-containing protein